MKNIQKEMDDKGSGESQECELAGVLSPINFWCCPSSFHFPLRYFESRPICLISAYLNVERKMCDAPLLSLCATINQSVIISRVD